MTGPSKDRPSKDHPRSGLSNFAPEQLVRINRWCDQFERLWRENGSASLEDFLLQVPTDDREAVIRELVLIDIELRQLKGLNAPADPYMRACPTLDRAWLDEQIAQAAARAQLIATSGLLTGQRVGDYVILEPLGAGGCRKSHLS